MSVATHLGIDLREYDARIRTFIPDYEEMLDAAAQVMPSAARRILDLGTGTGALAARCLARAPHASVVGVDEDASMLTIAARRLRARDATLVTGSFLRVVLPRADVAVASFALHHVRRRAQKQALYRRIRAAVGRRGLFVIVDCCPATDRTLERGQFEAWRAHLRRGYSAADANRLLSAWAKEDVYLPLDVEIDLLRKAGFATEITWRKGAFAVLAARAVAARRQAL